MPLDFTYIDERAKNVAMWQNTTGQRLFLSHDHSKVVMEGDEEAGFVLVGPRGSIPMADAVKYGLVAADDVPLAQHPDMPEATAEPNEEVVTALQGLPEEESMEDEQEESKVQEEAETKAQAPVQDKSVRSGASTSTKKS